MRLGRYFAVTEIFVVGYPKIGPNPKNHYCTKTEDVLKKYQKFLKERKEQKISSLSKIKFKSSLNKSVTASEHRPSLNEAINLKSKGQTKIRFEANPNKNMKIDIAQMYSKFDNPAFEGIKKNFGNNPKIFKCV